MGGVVESIIKAVICKIILLISGCGGKDWCCF